MLQNRRSTCGFGLLQQESRLDAASEAHAHYLAQNSLDNPGTVFTGHFEDATRPYFTGVAPWDRALAAGYTDSVAEVVFSEWRTYGVTTPSPAGNDEAQGVAGMRVFLDSVYHLKGALLAGRLGGVGAISKTGPFAADIEQSQFRLSVLLSEEKQRLGTGVVATYPCAGITDADSTFLPTSESPNPFPDVTDRTVAYGQPIYFKADAGSTLQLTESRVTQESNGLQIAHRAVTQANDIAALVNANEAFIVPTSALMAGTRYTVTATGTVNGTAFTKTFTFATR